MSARPWVAWAEAQLGELAERRLLRSLRSLTPQPSPNGVAAALVGDATYQQMLDNVPSTGEVEAAVTPNPTIHIIKVEVVANPIQFIISEVVADPIPFKIIMEVALVVNRFPFIRC